MEDEKFQEINQFDNQVRHNYPLHALKWLEIRFLPKLKSYKLEKLDKFRIGFVSGL